MVILTEERKLLQDYIRLVIDAEELQKKATELVSQANTLIKEQNIIQRDVIHIIKVDGEDYAVSIISSNSRVTLEIPKIHN